MVFIPLELILILNLSMDYRLFLCRCSHHCHSQQGLGKRRENEKYADSG